MLSAWFFAEMFSLQNWLWSTAERLNLEKNTKSVDLNRCFKMNFCLPKWKTGFYATVNGPSKTCWPQQERTEGTFGSVWRSLQLPPSAGSSLSQLNNHLHHHLFEKRINMHQLTVKQFHIFKMKNNIRWAFQRSSKFNKFKVREKNKNTRGRGERGLFSGSTYLAQPPPSPPHTHTHTHTHPSTLFLKRAETIVNTYAIARADYLTCAT